MTLTLEQVEKISAELKALPPVENQQRQVSRQEAVKRLAKDIAELQKRGYTLEQVAAVLQEKGLEMGVTTLKSCLRRARPAKKIETPARPRKGSTPEIELGIENATLLAVENNA